MLPTIEQDPTNLSFGILRENTRFDLTVLQEEIVGVAGWRFVFQIVGESHRVLVYQNQQLQYQEVLACIPLLPEDCDYHASFGELQDYHLVVAPYQFDIRFSTETMPLFTQPDMEVRFPKMHSVTPVTQLRWEDNGHSMRWWTLHLYPRRHDTVTVLTYSDYNYSHSMI